MTGLHPRAWLLAIPLLTACATTKAQAQPPPKLPPNTHLCAFDITDASEGQAARTEHFDVVSSEHSIAEISGRGRDDSRYTIRVTWQTDHIEISVERDGRVGFRLRTQVGIAQGQKVSLGKVARADAGTTEVSMIVQ